jgi:mono/diheme cytochrome c family protein
MALLRCITSKLNQMRIAMDKFFIVLLLSITLLFTSCDRDHNTTGWDYFPDMAYSHAYETNTPNPNTRDGKTMLVPAKGTIPREMIPFPYVKSEEEAARAGKELKNPLLSTDENLARGKEEFTIYCAVCHGDKGDGKGYLFTSGKYPLPPKSLVAERVVKKADGEIFHNITLGWGAMGTYGLLVRPEDRWKIILYVRELQKSQEDSLKVK